MTEIELLTQIAEKMSEACVSLVVIMICVSVLTGFLVGRMWVVR